MAPTITKYSELQQDEIDALRSIYPDDFVEEAVQLGAWNKPSDRAFRISLNKTSEGGGKLTITLSVTLPPTYPKSPPKLSLRFDDQIRHSTRTAAQDVIREIPKTLLGSEMLYDLTTALQETLDNSSTVDPKDILTLDEERAAREEAAGKEARELEATRELEARKAAERAALSQENEHTLQVLAQERARAERRNANLTIAQQRTVLPLDIPGGLTFDRPSAKVREPTGRVIDVGAVFHKMQYRKGPVTTIFLVQPWHEPDSDRQNPFLCLKEFHVQGEDSSFRRKIQGLESRLEIQMRAATHPSIVNPLNFRIQRSSSGEGVIISWSISILTEFTPKGSLQDFLNIAETVDYKRTKLWSLQLLEGLHFYHQRGSAHGNVHLANILLWESETFTTVARWSDGVYGSAMQLLTDEAHPKLPPGWTAPEALTTQDRQDPDTSTDIWNFGLCLLQLAFGQNVLRKYGTPSVAIGELGLTQSFKSLVGALFSTNVKKRPSAWDLLHFEFFRNDDLFLAEYEGSHQLTKIRTRRESEAPTDVSEYARKFVEEGRLGRGGFGEVFRARNKTDGQLYAVKKIKAQSRRALDPVLSEVTVLSRLNHPNVVRYFASWIEEDVSVSMRDTSDLSISEETATMSMSSLGLNPVLPPSSRGLDFISSNHIVFGNAEESDSDSGSSDSDSESIGDSNEAMGAIDAKYENGDIITSSLHTDESNDLNGNRRQTEDTLTMLYIQMEYCKQETLRDLINSGVQSDVTECWRLFRQIVQGLEHIHSASIVHRDLKPENVFIDSTGDLRIGDFGLARPGENRMPGLAIDTTPRGGSFTKDIGTAWYVAPEVRSTGGGRYDEKADIYSLGIILLELHVAFATAMERASTLQPFAAEGSKLPSALSTPEKATQASMFMAMIQYQPSQRPSCSDLLREIPIQDEDVTSRFVRRELNDPKSQLRFEFVRSVFAVASKDDDAYTRDAPLTIGQKVKLQEGLAAMSRVLPDLELQAKVKRQLTTIFRRHGAIERTDNPAVFPLHPCYAASDVIRIMGSSGELLQLPYDLILPNAILLARSRRTAAKTFTFGDVYRPDPRKEDPNIFGEVDFDSVGTDSANLVLDEAEIVKTVDEILDAFPNLSSTSMCYHINHSQLLDRVLTSCSVPHNKWFAAKEIVSKLNTADWTWPRVRHELRSPPVSLASTSLDELERYDFRDPLDKAIPKLRSMLQDTTEIDATFAHLTTLVTYLSRLNVQRKVYLNPLSSYNEKFYRGHTFFQCLYDRKRRAVFAAGGRYDSLIRDHQTLPSREASVHGVGFQMTWSGLCTGMMSWLHAQTKPTGKRRPRRDITQWRTRRCDVLIDCYDADLLDKVGLKILSELWGSSISAELANVDGSTAGSNVFTKAAPAKIDHNWIILIKSAEVVKIRNTNRQDETEVRTADLAHFLRGEIRERDRNEGRQPTATMSRHDSQSERPTNDQEPDVKVITPLNKGKKTNRKTIVEEAIAQAQEWRKSSTDDPIIAIETKDEVFRGLQGTRLEDTDSWKRLIQGAPAGERQYLAKVQDVLKEQIGRNAVFLYNYRTKATLYYLLPHERIQFRS